MAKGQGGVLDLRGEECPGPLAKTLRALSALREGKKIVVLMSSRECAEVLIELLKSLGFGNVNVIIQNNHVEVTIG